VHKPLPKETRKQPNLSKGSVRDDSVRENKKKNRGTGGRTVHKF